MTVCGRSEDRGRQIEDEIRKSGGTAQYVRTDLTVVNRLLFLRDLAIAGHQASIDEDGVFRAVISHTDPGVGNWLDPGGYEPVLVCARYSTPSGDAIRRLSTVPLAEVLDALPAGTAVVTPEQRQDLLRRRMLAVRKTLRDYSGGRSAAAPQPPASEGRQGECPGKPLPEFAGVVSAAP